MGRRGDVDADADAGAGGVVGAAGADPVHDGFASRPQRPNPRHDRDRGGLGRRGSQRCAFGGLRRGRWCLADPPRRDQPRRTRPGRGPARPRRPRPHRRDVSAAGPGARTVRRFTGPGRRVVERRGGPDRGGVATTPRPAPGVDRVRVCAGSTRRRRRRSSRRHVGDRNGPPALGQRVAPGDRRGAGRMDGVGDGVCPPTPDRVGRHRVFGLHGADRRQASGRPGGGVVDRRDGRSCGPSPRRPDQHTGVGGDRADVLESGQRHDDRRPPVVRGGGGVVVDRRRFARLPKRVVAERDRRPGCFRRHGRPAPGGIGPGRSVGPTGIARCPRRCRRTTDAVGRGHDAAVATGVGRRSAVVAGGGVGQLRRHGRDDAVDLVAVQCRHADRRAGQRRRRPAAVRRRRGQLRHGGGGPGVAAGRSAARVRHLRCDRQFAVAGRRRPGRPRRTLLRPVAAGLVGRGVLRRMRRVVPHPGPSSDGLVLRRSDRVLRLSPAAAGPGGRRVGGVGGRRLDADSSRPAAAGRRGDVRRRRPRHGRRPPLGRRHRSDDRRGTSAPDLVVRRRADGQPAGGRVRNRHNALVDGRPAAGRPLPVARRRRSLQRPTAVVVPVRRRPHRHAAGVAANRRTRRPRLGPRHRRPRNPGANRRRR